MSTQTPKTCKTCAHFIGFSFAFATCAYSGGYAQLSRKYGICPPDFSPWRPRQSLPIRIWQVFAGVTTPTGANHE